MRKSLQRCDRLGSKTSGGTQPSLSKLGSKATWPLVEESRWTLGLSRPINLRTHCPQIGIMPNSKMQKRNIYKIIARILHRSLLKSSSVLKEEMRQLLHLAEDPSTKAQLNSLHPHTKRWEEMTEAGRLAHKCSRR